MTLSAQQLAMRQTGIGASEIAAVLGMDPYVSPHDIYLRKTGRAAEVEQTVAMEFGHLLEQPIALYYAKRNKVQISPADTVVHPARRWMFATPDRWVHTGDPGALPAYALEVKSKGWHQRLHWGQSGDPEGVPDVVALQCIWGMSVTELERWDIAVLINNSDYREYTLTRDRELEADILEVAHTFWTKYVQADTPPPVDGSAGAARMLRRLYPREASGMKPAPAGAFDWVAERQALQAEIKEREAKIDGLDNLLKAAIGDAEGIEATWGRVTYRSAKGRIDWRAAAEAAGITEKDAEAYRAEGARRLDIRLRKGH